MSELALHEVRVSVGTKEVVSGASLTVRSGEVHVLMGPNGSGKSSLAHALAGRPGYEVTGGSATIDGTELLDLSASQRARAGLILAMQQPLEIPGVRPAQMLVAAGVPSDTVDRRLALEAERLGVDDALLRRFINVDLSGGERKRAEVAQLGVLQPKFALLDEVDSGLDVDALVAVARRLATMAAEWSCGILAITHFTRLLEHLTPTTVHVMFGGRIVRSGGPELADEIQAAGYGGYRTAPASDNP